MSTNSLNLDLRQDTAELDVTLFDLGETESAIHAEGSMGEYGKVYATLRLKYGMDRTSGTLTSQGRGVVDEHTFLRVPVLGSGIAKVLKFKSRKLVSLMMELKTFTKRQWTQ